MTLKTFVTAAAVGTAVCLAPAGRAMVIPDTPPLRMERSIARVVGTGGTYNEAYRAAKDQLPSGKSHYKIEQQRRADGTYKVTLSYYN